MTDNFNSYTSGGIVGQGGWQSYVLGGNFIVQNATTSEGAGALYNHSAGDSVVTKAGTLTQDGSQAVYVRSENRSSWVSSGDGNAQVRVSKGAWASGAPGLAFAAVSFKASGNVAYYDVVHDTYANFATYNDHEWTLLEIQWRSSDTKARYRVNQGTWTDWYTFANTSSFTGFDHVGFDFDSRGGTSDSGGVYFDSLH